MKCTACGIAMLWRRDDCHVNFHRMMALAIGAVNAYFFTGRIRSTRRSRQKQICGVSSSGVLIASKGNPCGQILRCTCETMPQLSQTNLKVLRKPSKYSNICNILSAGDFIVKLLFSNSL